MSAQFISRNPLFFCKRGWESHFRQNQVGKQLQVSMEKITRISEILIKNCFSYSNKVFLPFKKIY